MPDIHDPFEENNIIFWEHEGRVMTVYQKGELGWQSTNSPAWRSFEQICRWNQGTSELYKVLQVDNWSAVDFSDPGAMSDETEDR